MKDTTSIKLMVDGKQKLDRLAFGPRELAKAIGASDGFIRLEMKRGRIAGIKRGRRIFIPRAEVERYLSEER